MPTPIPFPVHRADPGFAHGEINVTLAYENLSAALWASETLNRLFCQIADGPEAHLSPWNFSTLEDSFLRVPATDAAIQSDLIVIALSSANHVLPASVATWLRNCLAQRRGAHTAVAALFAPSHSAHRPDATGIQTLQRLTEEAGCEFIASSVTERALSVA
jgi:hypothetical protein